MPVHTLEDGPGSAWPAKATMLARMAVMRLPVPPGIVLPLDPAALDESSVAAAVSTLLAGGPLFARAALAGEDEADRTGAGLGESVGGLRTIEAVRAAVRRIADRRDEPWLQSYRLGPSTPRDRLIVQREIPAQWLVVAALLRDGLDYVEIHPGGTAALGAGTSPAYAGSLARWDDDARDALVRICRRLRDHVELGPHGLDVELVIDPADEVWVVQARPIVSDVREGWEAFAAELQRQRQLDGLDGVLVLDAEHNPTPLSRAHAWLMQWLALARPSAGHPKVLAGWLYVRTLPRDLARRATDAPSRDDTTRASSGPKALGDALHHLRDTLIPEGRRRLQLIEDRLTRADASETADALGQALDDFAWMIDQYLGILVPARALARATGESSTTTIDPADPFSTRAREAFADVLPALWDIASPSLAELGWGGASTTHTTVPSIPTDPAAQATLLAEWDDHLFALGLAPLRRVYRRAGALCNLGNDVFLLDGDELRRVLRGQIIAHEAWLEERRRERARFERLRPPLRIEDGHPVPSAPATRLRGIGIGRDAAGRVARRRDLQHLLRDPPDANAIVVIPALTAQAAVALRDLGVRAVCCAYGGALSHATLMARELGLSALIGCRGCLDVPDGTDVRLDARLGRLLIPPTTLVND